MINITKLFRYTLPLFNLLKLNKNIKIMTDLFETFNKDMSHDKRGFKKYATHLSWIA